ncbi:hypothetical protein BSM4216_0544 [Bacillus smithii]|nr:hypothetical protein BSM4216_0544 [Bacillus smithii]
MKDMGTVIIVEPNHRKSDKNAFSLNNNSNEQINEERRVYE